MDLVFLVGCKKGSMEHVMNFPCLRGAELVGD